MKYQLKPIDIQDNENIEKIVYIIAHCLSLAGFSITPEVYNQLLSDERKLFEPYADELTDFYWLGEKNYISSERYKKGECNCGACEGHL